MNRTKGIIFIVIAIVGLAAIIFAVSTHLENQRDKEYYELMTPITPYRDNTTWYTHEYRLNDQEVLVYAPEAYRDPQGNTYVNGKSGYYIRRRATFFYTYDRVTDAQLKEIFGR
jgi:glucan phosphoethanolaminetransferase (alkaline phosphatase superfamily)